MNYINKSTVKKLALSVAVQSNRRHLRGKDRVSAEFLEKVEAGLVQVVHGLVNHHDNITNSRRTLK